MHIVQRGAVQPLIEMLQSPDTQLKEMSAFALGRLAQVFIFYDLMICLHLYSVQATLALKPPFFWQKFSVVINKINDAIYP